MLQTDLGVRNPHSNGRLKHVPVVELIAHSAIIVCTGVLIHGVITSIGTCTTSTSSGSGSSSSSSGTLAGFVVHARFVGGDLAFGTETLL